MKIGILTYYNVHNHGAVLQANALKKVLEAQGHEVKFLTFERSYEYISSEQKKKYKISLASFLYYIKYMMQKGVGNILYNLQKSRTLKAFRKANFDLSTSYNLFDRDVIIIGSDEVFSLEIGFNPILYGNNLNCEKVFSYAGSFGPTKLEDINRLEKRDAITYGMNHMLAISVRDENSKFIVKELTGKEVPVVCDPVILYGYEKELKNKNIDDYILVYAYDGRMNDADEVNKIKSFAKRYHKKIYSVGYYHKWCDRNINVSPEQLLGYINNASLVITDTFHGTVMSIISNTPMVVKLRGNSNKLYYLLAEYNLQGQVINDFEELEKKSKNTIDFKSINQKLNEKRKFSMDFLTSILERHKC